MMVKDGGRMHRHVRESQVGKQEWVSVIRREAVEDHVVLHYPVRWRLLQRIWNAGLPCGVWGRETPF